MREFEGDEYIYYLDCGDVSQVCTYVKVYQIILNVWFDVHQLYPNKVVKKHKQKPENLFSFFLALLQSSSAFYAW